MHVHHTYTYICVSIAGCGRSQKLKRCVALRCRSLMPRGSAPKQPSKVNRDGETWWRKLVEGCIESVRLAFQDTERLKGLQHQRERRLVGVSFKDGLPGATQANVEAHSYLLRELIKAGALETKAVAPIREGSMALNPFHRYKLSHRKSNKGKKQ